MVKNWPDQAGDTGDAMPGMGRFPEGGNGKSLQYSCLGIPIYRGVGQATVTKSGVAKSGT